MKPLFCFVMCLICLFGNSQIREKGTIEVTPIMGYSASFQLGSLLFGSSAVSGIQGGVYGDYYFNSRWSLRTGLLYQQMGTNNVDFSIFANEYSERTNYITVPLTVNFHLGRQRNWYINYGVAIGFLIDAEAKYNNGDEFSDITDLAKPTQFGINSGIGYRFKIAQELFIVLENSYLLGLTDTTKHRTGKNFYVSLNLGVLLKI